MSTFKQESLSEPPPAYCIESQNVSTARIDMHMTIDDIVPNSSPKRPSACSTAIREMFKSIFSACSMRLVIVLVGFSIISYLIYDTVMIIPLINSSCPEDIRGAVNWIVIVYHVQSALFILTSLIAWKCESHIPFLAFVWPGVVCLFFNAIYFSNAGTINPMCAVSSVNVWYMMSWITYSVGGIIVLLRLFYWLVQ